LVHDPSEAGWTIHEYIHLNPVRVKRFGAGRADHEGPGAEQIAGKSDRLEQKPLRALEDPPVDWGKIAAAIEKLWGEPWKKISQHHGDPGRELAMLIARRFAGMSLREIGEG
jgi:hypothetical protein